MSKKQKSYDELLEEVEQLKELNDILEVRASEAFSSVLLNIVDALVVVLDPNGVIMMLNETCEKTLGYTTMEVRGKPFAPLVLDPQDESEPLRAVFQGLEWGVFPNGYESIWLTGKGERRTISWSNTVICHPVDVVKYVIFTGVDVTRLRAAEKQVRESAALLSAFASNFPNGSIFMFDRNMRYQLYDGLEMRDHATHNPYLGKTLYEAFPSMAEASEQAYLEALDGVPTVTEVIIRGQIYLQVIHPVRDENDLIIGGLGFTQNITQRKESENRLAVQAKELERSNTELERFAYAASHDLQEPLRMVTQYLTLLEHRFKSDLDSDARTFISYAVGGADRMRGMIQDLLEYARVNMAGKPFRTVSLDEILQTSLLHLEVAITESSAVITLDPLPAIHADANQMIRLFQNLLGNAIKFRRYKVPLEIHVAAKEDGENWVISVRDNGIGMEERFLSRIFDLFQRLHTRDEYPGTGLGLALSQRIVERHGGRIWAESEPGKGSTFYFTLPRVASNILKLI